MSGVDKDALIAEADQLAAKLKLAADAKRAALQADGRPFDRAAFVQGRDLDVRYESGPGFEPYRTQPTLLSLTLGITWREWAWTLAGAAVVYGTAFYHAPSLRSRFSPHRLGALCTMPVIFIGYNSGLKSALSRHQGFLPNGNPTIIPGYDAESTVPYLLRHKANLVNPAIMTGPVKRESERSSAGSGDPEVAAVARAVAREIRRGTLDGKYDDEKTTPQAKSPLA